MSTAVFREMVERVLSHEGGYVNHPEDPGGETNWGISKRSYPNVNIRNLTRSQAIDIYYADFWLAVDGDGLHPGMAFQMFDAAINHGIGNAIRMAQRAAGVLDDGGWGPVTRRAVLGMEKNDFIMLFIAERLTFWTKSVKWPTFGKGWTIRGAQQLRYGAKDNDLLS